MGKRHFEQMYNEALDIDSRALLQFADLLNIAYWRNTPADVLVEHARKLNNIEDEYSDAIKELMSRNIVSVICRNKVTGQYLNVKDPAIIDATVPVLPEDAFNSALMTIPTKILLRGCDGSSNSVSDS